MFRSALLHLKLIRNFYFFFSLCIKIVIETWRDFSQSTLTFLLGRALGGQGWFTRKKRWEWVVQRNLDPLLCAKIIRRSKSTMLTVCYPNERFWFNFFITDYFPFACAESQVQLPLRPKKYIKQKTIVDHRFESSNYSTEALEACSTWALIDHLDNKTPHLHSPKERKWNLWSALPPNKQVPIEDKSTY